MEEMQRTFQALGPHIQRLLLKCLHHFKSDLINSMDHKHDYSIRVIQEQLPTQKEWYQV